MKTPPSLGRPRADRDDTILALDIATATGWCAGKPSDDRPLWGSHRLRADLGHAGKLIEWESFLRERISEIQPKLVVREEPPSIRWGGKKTNANTLLLLNGLGAKCEEVCARLKIECKEVGIAQWRKGLGLGKFGKEDRPYPPIEAMAQRGWLVRDHNCADAMGVWLFAVAWRAPKLAARHDPLAIRARNGGRCFVSWGYCATHMRPALGCAADRQ